MSSSHFVFRFISAIWRGADGLRKVLHLVLMLLLFLMFFGLLSGEAPHLMPQRAALYLQPVGSLVEQMPDLTRIRGGYTRSCKKCDCRLL